MRAGKFMALAAAVMLAGCAGYKLGPSNGLPAGARSVSIQPFINKTHEPRISEYMAMSLRRELQGEGSYHLQTSGEPDIWLTGEITRYERSGLSYTTNDVLTPSEYTLTLTAHVTARDANTGRVIFARDARGQTYINIGSDLGAAEREAMPILTDKVAQSIINQLTDGTW
jgi:hypothetical protein